MNNIPEEIGVKLNELMQELLPYENTLVINKSNEVCRLVSVLYSEKDDEFYWVYDTHNGIEFESCVVGWIPLKGFIREKDYDNLVRVWNLNNKHKAE